MNDVDKRLFIVIIIAPLLVFSCRSSKIGMTPVQNGGSAASYIGTYRDIAILEMNRTGVPASITLAQGMIESGLGKSRLALEANNHFGIKCHNGWTGPTIRHTDDRRNECFRKYRSAEESFRDHSDFLLSTPRYRFLFDLERTDYKGWAAGLKKAGYATNPGYAQMLVRKIEEYGLNNYDHMTAADKVIKDKVLNKNKMPVTAVSPVESPNGKAEGADFSYLSLPARVKENNRIQYIIVNERDTKTGIEKELGLLPWELQRYNEMDPDFSLVPGQILYLQPKRNKAEAGKEYHTAGEGESMREISQAYGIKLKQLYIFNRMEEGEEPVAGQKIWLRQVRPGGLK